MEPHREVKSSKTNARGFTLRNLAVDNAKFALILLVVFGHLIEPQVSQSEYLYSLFKAIYAFHMPAFIVLAGVFFSTSENTRKTVNQVIMPFLLYSVIYEAIYFVELNGVSGYIRNYYPVWIMWFLYSLAIWRMITPAFLKLPNPITVSIIISIVLLSFDLVGYPFGAARTLSFFPFFLIGYVYKHKLIDFAFTNRRMKLGGIVFLICLIIAASWKVDHRLWFGSANMVTLGYVFYQGVIVKFFAMTLSLIMSIAFFCVIPSTENRLTFIGQKTLHVYLVHGILVKLLSLFGIFTVLYEFFGSVLYSFIMCLLAIAITVLLSMDWVSKINLMLFKKVSPLNQRNNGA
ncbi:TPA: acyltransferase family protein [Photobacterium damselae]